MILNSLEKSYGKRAPFSHGEMAKASCGSKCQVRPPFLPLERLENGKLCMGKEALTMIQAGKELRSKAEQQEVVLDGCDDDEICKADMSDAVALINLLNKCAQRKDLLWGSRLHADVVTSGLLHQDAFVGGTLVRMYAKCGALGKAQEVFNELPTHNVILWTILIVGYVQHGYGEEALKCFECMQSEGLSSDAVTLACILKACGITGELDKGRVIHAQILRDGLLNEDVVICTALVDMYAKFGMMRTAQEVFDDLPSRNVVSWNALVTGYVQHGKFEEALNCFIEFQSEGLSPDTTTFAGVLKACGSIGAVDKGQEIHAQITSDRFLEDIIVANALVDMYAKCGALEKAQEAFNELPFRNVVSWTVLISAYVEHGYGEESLVAFGMMLDEGVPPDRAALACILKACSSVQVLNKGLQIHSQIVLGGFLERDVSLGSGLVDMYAKCGCLERAQEVFDKLTVHSLILWNALIAGYAQHGHGHEVLRCFKLMQQECFTPDVITFVYCCKACSSLEVARKCQEIHAQTVICGLPSTEIIFATALVDMYAKCGCVDEAQKVFDWHGPHDVVLWNAVITGYIQHGHFAIAINCFKQMQQEGVLPNIVTYTCHAKACGGLKAVHKVREVHACITQRGTMASCVALMNVLIDMYAKCKDVSRAHDVFDQVPSKEVGSWNVLIAGYAQNALGTKALATFRQMLCEGFMADVATFSGILKSCGTIRAAGKGQQLHARIAGGSVLFEGDVVLATAIIDMYGKCGLLVKAQEAFSKLPVKTVVSWNALILAFAQNKLGLEALYCYDLMIQEGYRPDEVTFLSILKACGSIKAAYDGLAIHAEIVKDELLERDRVLGTALLDMYAKCGMLADAQDVFEELPYHDTASWNALVTGYAQYAHDEEALGYLEQMQVEGFAPDPITSVCALKACGSMGNAHKGQEFHDLIEKGGLLEKDVVVGNGVIDMYGSCGMLAEAWHVFEMLPVRDVVSWNVLISGFAKLGKAEKVFKLFDKMMGYGEEPDLVTFILVLNTCSNNGLLDEGQWYIASMSSSYNIIPSLEHYSCIVDLLGRAGNLQQAVELIKMMPFLASTANWHALLGACRKWEDPQVGIWAFEHAVQVEKMDIGAFISIDNIYGATHRQHDAGDKHERGNVLLDAHLTA